jgi:hypothetical protein
MLAGAAATPYKNNEPSCESRAMIPIEPLIAHQHAAAEREKVRRREEEEIMTGYRPEELNGNWQFKIVKGTFKTAAQVDAVVQEQAEYGWTLVEIFDQSRIRFKRSAAEAAKDSYREGNPFGTISKASGPGCASMMILLAVVAGAGWYWLT